MNWLVFPLFTFLAIAQVYASDVPNLSTNTPFTGQITCSRVRLRTGPSLDAQVIEELEKGALFIITGEEEDFYAVLPPENTRVYIFRTYVLDQIVEGSRVNVRLQPLIDAPVLAQLNTGDSVEGEIYQKNNRWLEIVPPASVRFYISKEYIQRLGGRGFLKELQKRQETAIGLLIEAKQMGERELKKPFLSIKMDEVFKDLQTITEKYPDFPETVQLAKEILLQFHNLYLNQKLAYLEDKVEQAQIIHAENTTGKGPELPTDQTDKPQTPSHWEEIEDDLYETWDRHQSESLSKDRFYQEQKNEAIFLRGVVEPYRPPVPNKPGDYLLVNSLNHFPVAYLYSTQVDLADHIGKEVILMASERPNHDFAFPAYFILQIE